jgi:hypothetical protein
LLFANLHDGSMTQENQDDGYVSYPVPDRPIAAR